MRRWKKTTKGLNAVNLPILLNGYAQQSRWVLSVVETPCQSVKGSQKASQTHDCDIAFDASLSQSEDNASVMSGSN
ncbi:hypothetical protein SISNIDRAFT_460667 [Sistotremastrum niveocremeum HHB9708]|uniref:Uncharacterized protein n=2 Tax=Sistotremastraceae TaxID=3402574 RepID=A0A164NI75_9AGAM|nr:hypothetical protein SISNIDRAFT_460667 [Sistotremastrum niveocremeum HHB9708]KZT35362.1 hypothetical protein SISSUDRAFT_1051528 [Sistotremastrum suecicum HHB10207 ss-3]